MQESSVHANAETPMYKSRLSPSLRIGHFAPLVSSDCGFACIEVGLHNATDLQPVMHHSMAHLPWH
jgi:hypothetical protein